MQTFLMKGHPMLHVPPPCPILLSSLFQFHVHFALAPCSYSKNVVLWIVLALVSIELFCLPLPCMCLSVATTGNYTAVVDSTITVADSIESSALKPITGDKPGIDIWLQPSEGVGRCWQYGQDSCYPCWHH